MTRQARTSLVLCSLWRSWEILGSLFTFCFTHPGLFSLTVSREPPCILDRFTKRLLWNIVWSRPVSMEEYYAESMLENKFCSNVAPSLSSGPPLIYKAKYKGLISKNQYPAITFDWSFLQTWGQRLWAAFLVFFSGIPHLPTLRDTWHVTYVTYVTHVTWHMWRARRDKR